MVKFGNGIDGIVFELLGAGAPFGDPISDNNAICSCDDTVIAGGTGEGARAKRKRAKLQCPNRGHANPSCASIAVLNFHSLSLSSSPTFKLRC